MKNIFAIFKKELRRFFTDKRMLFMLIMPGIIIFALYSLIGNFIPEADPDYTYIVYVENDTAEFASFHTNEMYKTEIHSISEWDKESVLNAIKEGDVHLFISYEEDIINKIATYEPSSGDPAPRIEMYYNSSSMESSNIFTYYSGILNAYEATISNKFDINPGLTQYDMATQEDMTARVLTSMLPYMMMIFLFSGCMAVVTESIAGEKERGTIASLLITPIKRSELAIGKILALSVTSLVSAGSSFIGLLVSLPQLLKGMNFTLDIYTPGAYFALLAVLIVTVLIFTVLLSMVSAISKSVKEATSYGVPLMLIVVVLGLSTLMSTGSVKSIWLYLIPLYNSVQCLVGIFSLTFNPMHFVVTVISNLLFVVGGVFVLAKMFNNEKIMFSR
ncbi:MAG: ABC-2 family transporter protein [Firmicutes bacterium ADurb.Bin080]|jgi:sodium transport system permease protein|nr:ABC transporter permease [Clostridiales bacterium]OQC11866.1 MAG: ABC-2 family transporter protein [Firmicutes bacterium ADurb.Bin080]